MTTVPEQRDSDQPGLAAEHHERPAYGAQPEDTQRPVALRHSDEAPDDPADWDSATTEPSQPRGTDDVKDGQVRAERETRKHIAGEPGDVVADGAEGESSYSSEREQGAAQPGTTGPAAASRTTDADTDTDGTGTTTQGEDAG